MHREHRSDPADPPDPGASRFVRFLTTPVPLENLGPKSSRPKSLGLPRDSSEYAAPIRSGSGPETPRWLARHRRLRGVFLDDGSSPRARRLGTHALTPGERKRRPPAHLLDRRPPKPGYERFADTLRLPRSGTRYTPRILHRLHPWKCLRAGLTRRE